MLCPQCQGKTLITNTYQAGGTTERRRKCLACDFRFVTGEEVRPYGKTRLPGKRKALTIAEVIEIKRALAAGEIPQKDLAEQFCISTSQMSKIALGKNWGYVQLPADP